MGLKPDEFWRLTVSEFNAAVDGYNERQQLETERSAYAAWLAAAIMRQKKLPSLQRLLRRKKRPADHDEDMRARRREFEELQKRFGVGGGGDG